MSDRDAVSSVYRDLLAAWNRRDGKAFAARGEGDRHQFRFIVAPEDSSELADLKPFVRDLMRHRGGLSQLNRATKADLMDHLLMEERLAAAPA